ncbi:Vacuolar protein-sorting-associated protein 36 [Emydomyces testavorans]|uniref:Vacuolar protein-sorting-associated protein 36 n=1 Tax=Emydomyces testavorans TaxID=2070801 RepID=A0AAF0IM21_9EURO|nr:Vacuolar protein-sorting-associated protein 36 [Emydomyces testavorans]
MLFKPIDLTTALRPSLLQGESLLFVQDAVGLYEGKFKIPNYQSGHAYLTSHRICYVGISEPRKYSVAIDLKEAGFLRSSPKVVIYPKPSRKLPGHNRSTGLTFAAEPVPLVKLSSSFQRAASPSLRQVEGVPRFGSATWVCPICTFSNPIPSNFDPSMATASTPLPPCLACGIKPPLTILLKAAIASATNRGITSPQASSATFLEERSEVLTADNNGNGNGNGIPLTAPYSTASSQKASCPRCTFVNHPSLLECEMCGAPLKRVDCIIPDRSDSPAPLSLTSQLENTELSESLKLSFRSGGEKVFYERLNDALIQRKWLLYDAPPVPQVPPFGGSEGTRTPRSDSIPTHEEAPRLRGVGIAGLERRGFQTRKNNETVIGNAFEDLEALMASAKEIVALAETLATEAGIRSSSPSLEANTVISQSAAALGMITTKDMLGSGSSSENLYLSELSRNLAEYLTDDREGVLRREGGIMSLIDLWAVFNSRRNGVELVSPFDFHKAAELWETLRLPVRLRRFKSGLLVVQPHDWTDERCIRLIESWLNELQREPPVSEVSWDWTVFGRGVTAQEAAQRFGWSVGVASEELEMAEDRGVLCREEGIEGIRFWQNHISSPRNGEGAMNQSVPEQFSRRFV